jgi:Domain of unknown function (DUF4062)
MDRVFQVFVSSTFSDLKDERRQVSNTLAKAGYVVAGMELFPATDQQQLVRTKNEVPPDSFLFSTESKSLNWRPTEKGR